MRDSRQNRPATVAVAIIPRGNEVLVGRRRSGSHLEGTWEFPGGKVEPGERPPDALRRELREELELSVGRAILFHREDYRYPDRRVEVLFYLCPDTKSSPQAAEGQELRWVSLEELRRLKTPEANRRVIDFLGSHFEG